MDFIPIFRRAAHSLILGVSWCYEIFILAGRGQGRLRFPALVPQKKFHGAKRKKYTNEASQKISFVQLKN